MKKTILPILMLFCFFAYVAKAQDLTSGLVSVWEFDETSGTSLNDSYGNNNGTNYGATINQTGTVGMSYLFNSSEGDYIEVTNDASLNISDSITISMWVKVNAAENTQVFIGKSVSGTSHISPWFAYSIHALYVNETTLTPRLWITTSSGTSSVTGAQMTVGNWYHLVGTYDGSYIRLYVNTSGSVSGKSGTINTYSTPLRIGTNGGYGENFQGTMDQVAIWNRALTASEVSDLYNSGSGLPYSQWGGSAPLTGGTISPSALTINYGEDPGTISNVEAASGGSEAITYTWEESVNDGGNWTTVIGETGTSYNAPALTQTHWYRRKAGSGAETAYSNESHITVTPVDTTVTLDTSAIGGTNILFYTNTIQVPTTEVSIQWPEAFPSTDYFMYVRAWTEESFDGKTVQVQNGVYDVNKATSGVSLKVKNANGYLTYYTADTTNLDFGNAISWEDTLTTIATKADLAGYWSKTEITEADTARWGTVYDDSETNEIQTLSILGDQLTISNGNTVNLPAGGGTTDHAALSNLDYSSSGHTGFAGTDISNVFTISQSISYTRPKIWLIDSDVSNYFGEIGYDSSSGLSFYVYDNGVFYHGGSFYKDHFRLKEKSSLPLTPNPGYFALYVKTDGKIYGKNDSGTEFDLTSSSGGSGAPIDATYLTTKPDSTLTNEVVVGTTPGGDLGGTWDNPTVDDNSHNHNSSTAPGTFTGVTSFGGLGYSGSELYLSYINTSGGLPGLGEYMWSTTGGSNGVGSFTINELRKVFGTNQAISTTLNWENGGKGTVTLTGNTTITVTNLPDGCEGQIEVMNSGYILNINGSTGYTTEQVMGSNSSIVSNGHTTVVYWRSGSTLYYGFIYDN